jgi:hypothetical protein
MFLPLLIVAAVLIGGWMFASIIFGGSDAGKSAQSPIALDRKVSLWSLLCLIFFPEFNAPKSP